VNDKNEPDKKSNAHIVVPAFLLVFFGCVIVLNHYFLAGVIVASVGLLAIAWAMLTGKLKLFG
jgi:hypothetical protein